jgi:hypothetical protein
MIRFLTVLFGSFVLIPLTYLMGFLFRHQSANHGSDYLILILYIFGHLAAEIFNKIEKTRENFPPVYMITLVLADPFIYFIQVPKIKDYFKKNSESYLVAYILFLVYFLIGIALIVLLNYLIERDLQKVKKHVGSKEKSSSKDEDEAALRVNQVSK